MLLPGGGGGAGAGESCPQRREPLQWETWRSGEPNDIRDCRIMKPSLPAEVSWFVSGEGETESQVRDVKLRMTQDGDAGRVYTMQRSVGFFSSGWAARVRRIGFLHGWLFACALL
jgi:hypothetical protein